MKESEKYHIQKTIERHNSDNPIYSKTLEQQFGVKGIVIRHIIRELRLEGHPIASGSKGYFYAKYKTELQPTIDSLKSRGMDMLATADKLNKVYEEETGQTTLL